MDTLNQYVDYSHHGVDLFCLLMEMIFNRMELPWVYVLGPISMIILYMFLAWVYFAARGQWLYSFLDWSKGPIAAAWYIGLLLIFTLLFVLQRYIHRGRDLALKRRRAVVAAEDGTGNLLDIKPRIGEYSQDRRKGNNDSTPAWQHLNPTIDINMQLTQTALALTLSLALALAASAAPAPAPAPQETTEQYKCVDLCLLVEENCLMESNSMLDCVNSYDKCHMECVPEAPVQQPPQSPPKEEHNEEHETTDIIPVPEPEETTEDEGYEDIPPPAGGEDFDDIEDESSDY
ncbi:hypothetical protein BGZ46_009325 [Entomortierella lignicola]|nr:hypothetical protein BGZ46_009325 [Entomortierella lignicola]